ELNAALARGEATKLRRTAHTLKGALGTFGAAEACALAQRMEDLGRDGRLQGGEEVYAALTEALSRLGPALSAYRAAGCTPARPPTDSPPRVGTRENQPDHYRPRTGVVFLGARSPWTLVDSSPSFAACPTPGENEVQRPAPANMETAVA